MMRTSAPPLHSLARLVPVAALVFAACSDQTLPTPSAVDDSEQARYQRALEQVERNPAPFTPYAGQALPHGPALASHDAVVVNGSFETGDFTGWTTSAPVFPLFPWSVDVAGSTHGFGVEPTSPQDGAFDAWHGFDAGFPGEFVLTQTVEIPDGSAATLSWMEKIQWTFFSGTQPKTHHVEILDPNTSDVLATVHDFSTGDPNANPNGNTGWSALSADVSAFLGQEVTLRFRQVIPEGFAGPGMFEVDAVAIEVETGPSTIEVEIDVKPGSDTNPLNLRGVRRGGGNGGVLPVAILTTDDFDAAEVDVSTVTLGDDDGDETGVIVKRNGAHQAGLEDVDDDGDLDLVLHFSLSELDANENLDDLGGQLHLNGATADGTPIHGADDVRVKG